MAGALSIHKPEFGLMSVDIRLTQSSQTFAGTATVHQGYGRFHIPTEQPMSVSSGVLLPDCQVSFTASGELGIGKLTILFKSLSNKAGQCRQNFGAVMAGIYTNPDVGDLPLGSHQKSVSCGNLESQQIAQGTVLLRNTLLGVSQ